MSRYTSKHRALQETRIMHSSAAFSPLFLSFFFFFNLFQAIQTPSSPNKSPPDTAIMQLIMAPAVRELHGKGLYNDEDIYGRPYCSFGKY